MEDGRDTAAEFERIHRALRALEERVARIEARPRRAAAAEDGELDFSEFEGAEVKLPAALASLPSFVGRLLLVLGGAFLLRSITEEGHLPEGVGAGLGFVYGLFWLVLAARAGRAGRQPVATWHGVGSALIVFPLIAEATARLGIFSFAVAAVLLVVATVPALLIAWRHRLAGLATLFVCGAGIAGLAILLPQAAAVLPLLLALLVVGLAALWAGRLAGWAGAVWVSAAVVDLATFLLAYRALTGTGPADAVALGLLLLVFVTYVGSITLYALRGWHRLGGFEVVQTAAVLALGFGGALQVAREAGVGGLALGLGSLVAALVLYAVAFTALDRTRRRRFYYLTTLALTLVMAGSASLMDAPALPWAVLAVVIALVARHYGRVTLGLHAALYATAAALSSGLLAWAAGAWADLGASGLPDAPAWISLAALGVVALTRVSSPGLAGPVWREAPRTAVLVLLVGAVGGLWLAGMGSLAPAGHDGASDPAWRAVLRTAALAALTLGAAWLARRALVSPLRRLVPVFLALGALKLLAEDLPAGRPATLALSFGLYGAALLLAPRLAKAAHPPVPAEPPAVESPATPAAPGSATEPAPDGSEQPAG